MLTFFYFIPQLMKIKGIELQQSNLVAADKIKIGIVKAAWNPLITDTMAEECKAALIQAGIQPENIISKIVPGSYELPLGALLIEQSHSPEAVICLGCVIKGSTDHDVFINQGIAAGIMDLNLKYGKPFVFGVLTVKTEAQAVARINGDVGNKGKEAAEAALSMIALQQQLKSERQGEIGFKSKR